MKKILLCLCMILLLAGCSPKIDYSFFQESDELLYVMEHNDKTKAEFESENKKTLVNYSEKSYETLYRLLTPYVIIRAEGNLLPHAAFEFGSVFNRFDTRTDEKYEIDEAAQKLTISGITTAGDDSHIGAFTYTFKIIDCETLQFIANESSSVDYGVEPSFLSVPDGAIFHLQK